MPKPEFPDDYYTTRERIEREITAATFETSSANADRYFECDFCSKGVPFRSTPRVGQYMTDRAAHSSTDLAQQITSLGRLTPMATYCEECSTRRLLFPCRGYTEVRLVFDLDADRQKSNVEITDISPADDGIPWDPGEVSEAITGMPFEMHTAMDPSLVWAPENIVTFFLSIGSEIDIRELVDYTGEIDRKMLGRVRKQFEQNASKMQGRGDFTEHVRGTWGPDDE